LAQPQIRAETEAGSHVIIFIIVIVVVVVIVRRLRLRLPWESVPLLPTTMLLQGVAEPPELFQLKCPSRTLKGSNTLKQE
jgi:hypothetical protein